MATVQEATDRVVLAQMRAANAWDHFAKERKELRLARAQLRRAQAKANRADTPPPTGG